MSTQVCAVIPARLGSRRFSGKVLFPYRGRPLLFYVWNAVRKARQIDDVIIGASPFVITMLLMLVILSVWPQIAQWLPQMAAT